MYFGCADGVEPIMSKISVAIHVQGRKSSTLGDDGSCIVVGHDVLGANHDIVPSFDELSLR